MCHVRLVYYKNYIYLTWLCRVFKAAVADPDTFPVCVHFILA